jgi:hypothetical protein
MMLSMNAQPPRRDRDHGAVSSRVGSNPITKPATLAKAAWSKASRRGLFKTDTALGLSMASLHPQPPKLENRRAPFPDVQDQDQDQVDPRHPNGKSQKDAIAQSEHEKALKDAEELASLSNELRDDIKKIGDFVVPVLALKKTHEIEKLARRLRSHLQS